MQNVSRFQTALDFNRTDSVRLYRLGLYSKARVRLPIAERKRFHRVSTVICMLWWRCYRPIKRCNQR